MGLFKSKSNSVKKDDGRPKGDLKKVKYVWLSSRKAIFIITGEPKESKYSYGVPIIPLHGYYKSNGKRYTAKELSDYYVVLNLPKDADIDELKGKKVVIVGYDKDSIYIDENETGKDKNESKGKGEDDDEDRDEGGEKE